MNVNACVPPVGARLWAALLWSIALYAGAGWCSPLQHRLMVALNPVKLVYGLPNLEVEYRLADKLSLAIWGEWLVSGHLVKKEKHPTVVFRAGPRRYLGTADAERPPVGFWMPWTGYSWSKEQHRRHHDIGFELGFKWFVRNGCYALPKGILTIPVASGRVLPGLELLAGRAF